MSNRDHFEGLTLARTALSVNGSGTASVDTYTDTTGNEWTSVGGSKPVLTATAEAIARSAAIRAEVAAWHLANPQPVAL